MNEEDQQKEVQRIDLDLPQLPKEAATKAAKLMTLSAAYMDSVVKELDLDPEEFYAGVGLGLKTILNVTASFLQEQEKKEHDNDP